MEKRSLKSLTVGDKIKIIEEDKDKILKAVEEAPCLPRRKRFKASSFPEIEHAMTEWIKRVRDYNFPISGPLILEKAAEFAKNLVLTFQASSGWLEKFKLRNGIVEKIISGENATVSEVDCEHYQTNILPSSLKEYDSKDIFNADEFGLFFKCTPDRTLTFKGDTCHGGKKSKERVTVMEELIVAAEITKMYHTIRHNPSYNSLDCSFKLDKLIFEDSKLAGKANCDRKKCKAIAQNVLALRSLFYVYQKIKNHNPP
ncbi:tigger transposable element-derived protein 4-like [Metopolophium dirhodum]|uniref:tigger transposable element-derived protein 4-like n=1 Tax=Metopolophium dirhodum TaxID=44670 RepID=UPI00298F80F9|nr:tigger transposable element-derived protein 4-like [Metopolophium dirhodum]